MTDNETKNQVLQQNPDGSWSPSIPLRASWEWMPRWLRKILRVPL